MGRRLPRRHRPGVQRTHGCRQERSTSTPSGIVPGRPEVVRRARGLVHPARGAGRRGPGDRERPRRVRGASRRSRRWPSRAAPGPTASRRSSSAATEDPGPGASTSAARPSSSRARSAWSRERSPWSPAMPWSSGCKGGPARGSCSPSRSIVTGAPFEIEDWRAVLARQCSSSFAPPCSRACPSSASCSTTASPSSLAEDHRAPLVSVGVMYAVGARNEAAGITGLAHYAEHMNFRATAGFPGTEITEAITRIGGRWNGYTWIDQTWYVETVHRDAFEKMLDLERGPHDGRALRSRGLPQGAHQRHRRAAFLRRPALGPLRRGAGGVVRDPSLPQQHHRVPERRAGGDPRPGLRLLPPLLPSEQRRPGRGRRHRRRRPRWRAIRARFGALPAGGESTAVRHRRAAADRPAPGDRPPARDRTRRRSSPSARPP